MCCSLRVVRQSTIHIHSDTPSASAAGEKPTSSSKPFHSRSCSPLGDGGNLKSKLGRTRMERIGPLASPLAFRSCSRAAVPHPLGFSSPPGRLQKAQHFLAAAGPRRRRACRRLCVTAIASDNGTGLGHRDCQCQWQWQYQGRCSLRSATVTRLWLVGDSEADPYRVTADHHRATH
jgi:hypothetical protein